MSEQASLRRVVPIVPARNVLESLAYYVERLGFNEVIRDGDPINYVVVRRGDVELHLSQCNDEMVGDYNGCRIFVDNIDALYREYREVGVVYPNGELAENSRGCKEFSVVDLCGILLTFCESV